MKKLLLMVLLATVITALNAQKVDIENVFKPLKSDFGAIKEGSEVKGYYFFWASDKIDKKTYEWTLRITDPALKTLKEVKMQESKTTAVIESSFNGTDLALLFYDNDANTLTYQMYGADGKKKYSYTRELSKKEDRYLRAMYGDLEDDENQFKGLYPVEGKGFISNTPSREDKDYTFRIDFFSTEKRKQWNYIPAMDGKKFIGDYLGTYNGVVYIELLKYSNMMDGKPESSVLGLSLETGKLLFERSTDGKNRFYPVSLYSFNGGKTYLFGEYYDLDANMNKAKSIGFAFWGIDGNGKILSEKYLTWESDMGKYLDVNAKGKIDDFGYMYLHNVVQTADGSIYAIGEGFQKAASALGIASKILGKGNSDLSVMKFKITDLILIRFDEALNVKDAKIYEKRANNYEMESGLEFASTQLLAKIADYNYGYFDYEYTQVSSDATSFTVAYSDKVREKDYKGTTFNAISYNNGKITTDRIETKGLAKRSYIFPAAQGSVLIIEIFKKEKKLEVHVEKMN